VGVGDLRVQLDRQDLPGSGVLEPVEELSQDPEGGRHHAAGDPRVHAVLEHVDGDRDVHRAAQRRRHPQPVVGERTRVEADEQVHLAQLPLELVEVRLEVAARRLLGRLDQDHAPGVLGALALERPDPEQRNEDRVPVVRHAARVEAVAAAHGLERPEAVGPVTERRLLVEVPVEDDGARVRPGRRDVDDEHRRPAG